MDYTDIFEGLHDELKFTLFRQPVNLCAVTSADNHTSILQKISQLPLLHERAAALRSWRLNAFKDTAFGEVVKMELNQKWPFGPALPLPDIQNPLGLPAHALTTDYDQNADIKQRQDYFDDMYATYHVQRDPKLRKALNKYSDIIGGKTHIIQQWASEFEADPHKNIAIIHARREALLRNHAFFDMNESFVGMGFLQDVLWDIKKSGDFETAFSISAGTDSARSMHMALIAERGMGKSTIVPYIGHAMRRLGLLEKGHVVKTTLADLCGPGLGYEEKALRDKFKEAKEGILFFDEADTGAGHMSRDQNRSPIMQTLNEMAEANRANTCLIVATYPSHADNMLDGDEGLRSRFGDRILRFPEYQTSDLVKMFELQIKRSGFFVENDAIRSRLWEFLHNMRDKNEKSFASGRTVREIVQKMQGVLATRLGAQGFSLGAAYNKSAQNSSNRMITLEDMTTALKKFSASTDVKKTDVFNEQNPFSDSSGTVQKADAAKVVSLITRTPA